MVTVVTRSSFSLLAGNKTQSEKIQLNKEKIIAQEINREKNERFAGADDVKKKFKSALDEYLERVQDYLQ